MTTELDALLALTPTGQHAYEAHLDGGWLIGHAVNGGALLAVVGQALRSSLAGGGHPDPVAVSAYYLSAGRPGPARLEVEPVRAGRLLATAGVSLVQDEDGTPVERLRALASYGDLSALDPEVRTMAEPPALPPVASCVDARMAPSGSAGDLPFLQRFEMRLDPATVGWALGEPSGNGVIQGWLRMADDREPDPVMLLLVVDALPPVTFDLGIKGWAATLELTAHVRARPEPGWLRVRVSSRNLAGGLLEEDAEVWDSADRLVAQSRQLVRVPRSA